jgi:hypothetical protein
MAISTSAPSTQTLKSRSRSVNGASIWWNPQRTASYNCLFNFIIGMRGAGKTYGFLKREIERFLKSPKSNRHQFIYMRRLKEELKKLTTAQNGRLFDAVQKEFPDHTLRAEGDVLYCDKEIMGYGVALSTSSKLKSDAFPHVREIGFDEFIIDNTRTYHYLPDEVRKFLDVYETIARPGNDPDRPDTLVWFLSNAVTINNPYFSEFKLMPPVNGDIQRFGKAKDMLVQNVVNQSLSERKKSTRFGKMISGSHYEEYAYENQWLMDDERFVEKKTQRSTYYMSLRFKDQWLGIWYDQLQMLFYVSLDFDPQYPIQYSATTDDHQPNTMLFKRSRSQSYISHLLDAYDSGGVRYESVKLKAWFREIVGMGW